MPTITVPRQKWPMGIVNSDAALISGIVWTPSITNTIFDIGLEPPHRQHTIIGFYKSGPGNTAIEIIAPTGGELIPQTPRDLQYRDDSTNKMREKSGGYTQAGSSTFDFLGGSDVQFVIPNAINRFDDDDNASETGRFLELEVSNSSSLFWCCLILPMVASEFQNPIYQDILFRNV